MKVIEIGLLVKLGRVLVDRYCGLSSSIFGLSFLVWMLNCFSRCCMKVLCEGLIFLWWNVWFSFLVCRLWLVVSFSRWLWLVWISLVSFLWLVCVLVISMFSFWLWLFVLCVCLLVSLVSDLL